MMEGDLSLRYSTQPLPLVSFSSISQIFGDPHVAKLYSTDRGGSGGDALVVGDVIDTETRVTGLTPGVLYTISVSSENNVSSQDNNINDRSVRTTATTEEGGE